MKLSEHIAQCQALLAEHGDVDVEVLGDYCCFENPDSPPEVQYHVQRNGTPRILIL